MKCFNHPGSDAVGTCNQCGKWGCRPCLSDVGGAILCIRCHRAAVSALDSELRTDAAAARKKIRNSAIVSGVMAVFSLLFTHSILWAAFSGYSWWSFLFGVGPVWRFTKRILSSVTFFATARGWVNIIVFFGWFVLIGGSVFGFCGGGFMEFLRLRRVSQVPVGAAEAAYGG